MENKKDGAEVNLKDYFKLIFSKKWLVLGVFFGAVAVAAIYNFSLPKPYEANVWLEIGKVRESSLVELIESPAQIGAKINNAIYGDFPYGAVIVNPEQTDLIQIKIKSVNPEKAKNDLEKISELILADHEKKIKIKQDVLEYGIKRLEANIIFFKEERKNLEAKLKTPLSEFNLSVTKDGLSEKNRQIEEAYSRIESLNNSLGNIQHTKVVKSAVVSGNPIKPKFLSNIAFAGMLGLFLGLFIVFLEKWWKEN